MLIDITGLDKAKLLVALYDNAKKSAWTEAIVYASICADVYYWDRHKSIYQERIDSKMDELGLTLEEAQLILDEKVFIGFIFPVYIGMDFTGNMINTSKYNAAHCYEKKMKVQVYTVNLNPQAPKCNLAEDIIAPFKEANKANQNAFFWDWVTVGAVMTVFAGGCWVALNKPRPRM